MEFRTQVPVTPQEPKIGYSSKVLLLGSCFVENIGNKLEYFKFPNLLNPFGILFHPAAIHNFLKRVKEQYIFTEADIFYHNETWKCYEAHSDLNSVEKEEILNKLNAAVQETREFLKTATHVVITPGTAWGYKLNETGQLLVANCHKVPQAKFSREITEVKNALFDTSEIVRSLNPSAQIIFTVSPVRHLKDGFVENQLSKAKLITAIQERVASEENCSYFPSYEIMMDELRDYRFYAEDMLHPNIVAVDYIWEKFRQGWIASAASEVMKQVDTIQKGLLHRPFNETSEAHQKFRRNLQQKIEKLEKEVPQIRF
ncbi:GSCFA domain-containing protein [Salinimicrobium tongyeongense]|uniref:GSCFA domain-containing protein n=1 Tax=Salinimicrobium tongyeongense TaxID=2809707 RepID=A0ABY6NUQ0_9FLAO|nr:GSCFA domain-containing protein [Salinimicrobium tongyeongense]UZH56218.1 GSCFA domain-containing protein [Salinimicrobium tongyeongense]